MDALKAVISDLIDRDRYRPSAHFLQRCAERDATVEDAIRVLRNGALDPSSGAMDPRFGATHVFRGLDTKDRRRAVVVGFAGGGATLVLITIFPAEK